MTLQEVVREALLLPPNERELVVRELIDSLEESGEPPLDDGWYEAWLPEIRKRIDDVESGRVTPIPWEEVKRGLDALVASRASK